MAARVVEIRDAVAAFIASQTYSFTFNVVAQTPARYELRDTNFTYVFVYQGPQGPSTATRNKWLHSYGIVVHVVNFIDSNDESEIDDVYLLAQEITDSLKEPRMSGVSLVEFGTEDNPAELLERASLLDKNTAQGAMRLVYNEMR